MNVTRSGRPPSQSVNPPTLGSSLGAALALSDERSSLVVLQGDNRARASQWLSAGSVLGQFLVGQHSLCILLQQPGEDLEQLQRRVSDRLASLETPPQHLLWVAPDDALGQRLLQLYASLTQHCGPEREVVLVTRNQLLSVQPFSIAAFSTAMSASCAADHVQGGTDAAKGATPLAVEPTDFDVPEEITSVQSVRSEQINGGQSTPAARHSSAPPRSEVQWSLPEEPDVPRRSLRSIR